ncbi:MAG: carboxypeptidase-like regulatory domain-containing protein, partial [Flavobacteriales bacterium]
MKKLLHILVGTISHLLITSFVLNPTGLGSIHGTVTDSQTGEGIPFANVVLLDSGQQITGAVTDFDGKYSISLIKPGTYSVEVSTVGYSPVRETQIPVLEEQVSIVDFKLSASTMLSEVMVTNYSISSSKRQKRLRKQEIRSLAGRGVSSITTQAVGVADNDGRVGSIKGTRAGSTDTYIDGVKVRGRSSLPQAAYDSPQMVEP